MAELGQSQHQLVDNEHSGRKLPQYVAALSATLGALAAGSVLGWNSPAGPKILSGNDYDFTVTQSEADWISSLPNIGAAVICFPIGIIMDRIGRKITMLLLVFPFLIGWGLIIWASGGAMLMAGRFITGVAGGAFCVTAPTYTSEIAQTEIRGSLGSYFQLMVTVGILFSYAVGSYTSLFLFNILCGIIPIVFGMVFFFMPESPSYLIVKGRVEDAQAALLKLRGIGYDCESELKILQDKVDESKANPVSFRNAITKRSAKIALMVSLCLMAFQQLSGVNAVIFNTTAIFESAGAAIPSEIATIVIGVIQVVATFISSLVVDKLGRRILLLFSAIAMVICSVALGIYFYLKDIHGDTSDLVISISWLPLVSLSLFMVAFSMGFGPIPWMIAGELCSLEIKGFVSAAAGTFNWLLSFAVTSTFNTLLIIMGDGPVFWLFAAITFVGIIFVFFVVPETKGKTSAEIQDLLEGTRKTRNDSKK